MRLVSTRNPSLRTTFLEAMRSGYAPDGGLWVPDPVACFRDVPRLLDTPFLPRSLEITHRLLGDEFSLEELEIAVLEALNLPLPAVRMGLRLVGLEAFRGPSAAVEDFGARLLARLVDLAVTHGAPRLRTTLTASPGASGAAVAQAFSGHRGTRAVILVPKGRVAPVEAGQIAAPGGNVLVFEVDGDLAACQGLVAACREDRALADRLNLCEADSTHLGWILAYVLLYFEGVAQARAAGLRDAPVVAVPGGDLGMLTAGLWAKGMGLPVKAFVVALNANASAGELLDRGQCAPPSVVPTLSRNLDVGAPANWERVQHLGAGRLRETVRWASLDNAATRQTLWGLHHLGCTTDPQGAVVFGALEERRALNEIGVLILPSHPIKAREMLEQDMHVRLPWPETLAELPEAPPAPKRLPADPGALKAALLG